MDVTAKDGVTEGSAADEMCPLTAATKWAGAGNGEHFCHRQGCRHRDGNAAEMWMLQVPMDRGKRRRT